MQSILVFCACALAPARAQTTSDSTVRLPKIIGHRGASYDAPENTIPSFKLAYEQKADAAEFDIWSTSDQKLIVIHDANTKKLAGVDKKVTEQTFQELRKLEVGQWGKWKGSQYREKMPTVDEVLAIVPLGRPLFFHSYAEIRDLGQMREAIRRAGLQPAQVVFLSFQLEPCKAFKQLVPGCTANWLRGKPKAGEPQTIEEMIRLAKEAGLDGLSLSAEIPITKEMVDTVRRAGLGFHVWTVNDATMARRVVQAGVDSITTDRPGWLREQLQQRVQP